MTQIEQDEQEDKPLDPAMEKVRRKMIRLQIVSGSVMFISLMAVFGAVVYKAMGPSKAVQTQNEAPNLAVPTGNGPLAVTASRSASECFFDSTAGAPGACGDPLGRIFGSGLCRWRTTDPAGRAAVRVDA